MAKQDSMLEQASKVEQEYKQVLEYKKQQSFNTKWAEYERFKSGDQWPAPTNKTKNLPRPVFNIIEQIQGHKVAAVMNENIKMMYLAQEVPGEEDGEGNPEIEASDLFTRYADATWENIKQDSVNEEVLESASNTGTGIWHYYWDPTVSGGNRLKWQGEMKCEMIDPVNFFPGNPQNKDVQQQPYIIVTSRDLVSNVREEGKNNKLSNELLNLIQPDSETTDQAYDMAQHEVNGSEKVTVLTKYWRENGIIHFMKVASGIVVKPKTNTRMKLYPIEVLQWKRRKKSIFGVGDTEGLIPNQKAINFLMAMQLLSTQLTGWPKMIVNKNYVKSNPTNTPGEIINVQSDKAEDAIKYLSPGNIASHTPQLVESFMSYTKEVSGANENALGERDSADLNATAIMLLQKAAGVPIESIKRRFYQNMENIGLIWMEFWKVYYNTDRIITVKDDNGEEYSDVFNGSEFADLDMRLKIDVGPSSSYSESLMMTSLDKLFDAGHLNLEQYLKYAPKNVIPFKDRLLKEIQEMQEQGGGIEELLAQLPPEEQQAFMNAPPEQQQAIIQQLQGQPQQPQQPQVPQM